jgi:UDP-2,3-diacylglucosamine pyrophosphatase LpxH
LNMESGQKAPKTFYRSVFMSDFHLGTRGSNAAEIAAFLKSFECEYLYLVGDIIDGWRLKKAWYWDEDHNRVLRRITKKARSGTKVIYIPGNHDEMFRSAILQGAEVSGVKIVTRAIHVTADNRKLLVIHGDEFDNVIRYAKFLAYLGDTGYDIALCLNRWFNVVRRKLGYPYWSMSAWLKRQIKTAVQFIDSFEAAVSGEARKLGADGVVCGHIHTAKMTMIGGILYINDGDWVESLTAAVEYPCGRIELVDWGAVAGSASQGSLVTDESESTQTENPANIPVFGVSGS